jgi:myosin heavy subunit
MNMTPPLAVPNSLSKTELSTKALSKQIYSNLFDFLVVKLNQKNTSKEDCEYTIGLLDIFGFENFADGVNSLE